jgi:hypothetical protein
MLARVDDIESARLAAGIDDASALVAGDFFRREARPAILPEGLQRRPGSGRRLRVRQAGIGRGPLSPADSFASAARASSGTPSSPTTGSITSTMAVNPDPQPPGPGFPLTRPGLPGHPGRPWP